MPHRGDAACCVSTTFNNGLAKAVLLRPHHHNSRIEADRDLICICRTTGGGKVDAVHKRTDAAVRFGSYVERVGVLRESTWKQHATWIDQSDCSRTAVG